MTNQYSHDSIELYITNIYSDAELEDAHKNEKLDALYKSLMSFVTDAFKIPFNTIFSQVAFVSSHLKLEGRLAQAFHFYRINFLSKGNAGMEMDSGIQLKVRVGILSLLCDSIFNVKSEALTEEQLFAFKHTKTPRQHTEFVPYIRFSVSSLSLEHGFFMGLNEHDPGEEKKVIIDPMYQEALLEHLNQEMPYFNLPCDVGLINVKVIKGEYVPEMVILIPDFLLDVTAVAECYSFDGSNAKLHFLKKFTPKSTSESLFIGLCANYFLDELVVNPEVTFNDLLPNIFKISPLYLAARSNDEIKQMVQKAGIHFINLQQFVFRAREFDKLKLSKTLIEPSYCSPKYGFQGRLDLFVDDEENRAIIELKSGKTFRPNSYGLNISHYIQTLLYDLLVKKDFKTDKETKAYILYSALAQDSLRFAPPLRSEQLGALLVRNQVLSIEYRISLIDANGYDPTNVFGLAGQLVKMGLSGFTSSDLNRLNLTLESLSPLQLKYLKAYSGFIAREYFGSKSGFLRDSHTNGQAALWLNSPTTKEENHNMMGFLQAHEVAITDTDTMVTLNKSERTDVLADFRVGDIIVLYPTDEEGTFLWEGRQIFKGTLIANNEKSVVMRLRAKQNRTDLFYNSAIWNIEKDVIDSGFGGQFKSMISWAAADGYRKDLLMGVLPPRRPEREIELLGYDMSPFHRSLIEKALSCKDYFLLWGPPGTGKTSFMIKNMIHILTSNVEKPLLVLAYTNRAVDELCEAIESLGESHKDSYIRIGSRFGTDPAFVDKLLDVSLANIKNRKELLDLLKSKKIIIGTASSLLGKAELFDLLSFEWALIDEASQILDPSILEILTRVDRFIMIGDHKQLPAVVTQHKQWTEVADEEMNDAGIHDLSHSLFERLYLRAVDQGWDWAYGLLHQQGRMHEDIMAFPAKYFYQGQLTTLLPKQMEAEYLLETLEGGQSGHMSALSQKRVLYLPASQSSLGFHKMNDVEAELIKNILLDLNQLYLNSGKNLESISIGIITPFRAQIVNISNLLETLPFKLDITVDTVERFQGGAKDIIILSMVVSSPGQLQAIVSQNKEGIDRKMNVALTRAKERLIMIGNKEVLSTAAFYKEFIEEYGEEC